MTDPTLISTQVAFDAALACDETIYLAADADVLVRGTAEPYIVVTTGQPRVEAWGSSQPRVVAWESSQPRVVAWESSQPRIVAWGSSQPRIEAWGSSQPRVEARGYVSLVVVGRVQVTAHANVSVLAEGALPEISGGLVRRLLIRTPQEWCDYYGAVVQDGIAMLYKVVDDQYESLHGTSYAPGTSPQAGDWDGGVAECGAGFHFCATTGAARDYFRGATRFVRCPVALTDMRAPQAADAHPDKIKARGLAGPIVEVDEDGEPILRSESLT